MAEEPLKRQMYRLDYCPFRKGYFNATFRKEGSRPFLSHMDSTAQTEAFTRSGAEPPFRTEMVLGCRCRGRMYMKSTQNCVDVVFSGQWKDYPVDEDIRKARLKDNFYCCNFYVLAREDRLDERELEDIRDFFGLPEPERQSELLWQLMLPVRIADASRRMKDLP